MNNFLSFGKFVLAALAFSLVAGTAPARAEVVRHDDTSIGQELHLPVYEWSDPAVPQKGSIFAIHGATLYARRFETVARHLAHEGYPVYAVDLRGFGRWRSESQKFGGDDKIHYTMSENDILDVLSALQRAHPDQKVFCMGESLGANLAVWVGSTHPELVKGLILVSPCIKSYLHPGPRFVVSFLQAVLNPNKGLRLEPHIKPYLSDDRRVTAEYLNDPGICHELSPVDLIKSIKTNTLALMQKGKIPAKMPVLVIAGKKDKIYKASAIPPFVAQMGSQCKTVEIVPQKGHLLLEHSFTEPKILAIIDGWLTNSTRDSNTIAENSGGGTSKSAGSTTSETSLTTSSENSRTATNASANQNTAASSNIEQQVSGELVHTATPRQ